MDDLPPSLNDAEKWERGEDKPTWDDLRNMARKYKRPSYFYFLTHPPKEDDDLSDFRFKKSEPYSPTLRLEMRKAKSRRNAYLRIYEDSGMKVSNFTQYVCREKDYIKIADKIYTLLNEAFKTHRILNIKESFLNHLKEILFDKGILVFES